MELSQVISDFAVALKAVDDTSPQGRSKKFIYRPGVGPLTESEAVRQALEILKRLGYLAYVDAFPRPYPHSRQQCDLVIPGEWAVEFKLLRPFNDNGAEAEHWSENIIHPYLGNVSSVGDAIKLVRSGFPERKAIVLIGYEHVPPVIDFVPILQAFELIIERVVGIELGPRIVAEFGPLIHPVHQQGVVIGWEILSPLEFPEIPN